MEAPAILNRIMHEVTGGYCVKNDIILNYSYTKNTWYCKHVHQINGKTIIKTYDIQPAAARQLIIESLA